MCVIQTNDAVLHGTNLTTLMIQASLFFSRQSLVRFQQWSE